MARTDSKAAIAEFRAWAVAHIVECRALERQRTGFDAHLEACVERRALQTVLRILNGVPSPIARDLPEDTES